MEIAFNNYVKVDRYRYLYLLMIVLYAGMATKSVSALAFYNDTLLGFIIPILMTIVLLFRFRVDFGNRNYLLALSILTIWFIAQYLVKSVINLTLTLYVYYQLTLAFIVIQVYKEKLFWVYEDIAYKLCIISLILWGISIIVPNIMASFLHFFNNGRPNFSEGSIIVFTMGALSRADSVVRNFGFAWEPGRFACFICLAIFCNFLINGFLVKRNRRLIVFVITLLTTQSTTGVFTLMALMIVFVLNKKMRFKVPWLLVLVPAAIYLYSLDFAKGKLDKSMERAYAVMDYTDELGQNGYSLDRIESMVVEWNNFVNDPVLGYCEPRHSYYENYVASGFRSNNGTMNVLARYGALLGILIYICIYLSSKRIAAYFDDKVSVSYMIVFICISMSYLFSNIVLIMAFSFWGVFLPGQSLVKRGL